MSTITSEHDVVSLVRNEFGVALSSEDVSCFPKGTGVVHIYTPKSDEKRVLDLLEDKNCLVTHRHVRRKDDSKNALRVVVRNKASGEVFAENFQQKERYGGVPFEEV